MLIKSKTNSIHIFKIFFLIKKCTENVKHLLKYDDINISKQQHLQFAIVQLFSPLAMFACTILF